MEDSELVHCILCGHQFHPGGVDGFVYCSACGRRFNPHSSMEETVIIPPPEAAPAGEEDAAHVSSRTSRRFGDYDIVEEIARGGMGVVYLARQRVLKRVVALKVLRSGDSASEEERERLLREAKAAAGLSHPNIVPIHEFSIHQGQPYFTMDFIDGEPLDGVLERGPVRVREAVAVMEIVARAIAYAHTRGIIHRDLKPANIIITKDGRPMITDFGLAVEQAAEGETRRRMTMAGAIMGTIPYAPPEQAAGKIDQISERSDVYSMGAVLYEMVTGRPPFTGFTQFELMRRVINHDPAPPRNINPRVHRDVETIILKCLEKDQRRRYASAAAFADDCQAFLKGEVITARPATLGYRCRRFLTKRPLLNFLAACVIALSLAVWIGLDHFRALAEAKEKTDLDLVTAMAERERAELDREETQRQLLREWRTEYNIIFHYYYFRLVPEIDVALNEGVPWTNPDLLRGGAIGESASARFLYDPPRMALFDPMEGPEPESLFDRPMHLGLPFSFPRDVRVALRMQTPAENVGELILSLDVGRDFRPGLGSTTVRFGSPEHPGVTFYRSQAVIGEDTAFYLRPDTAFELVLERANERLRAFVDGRLILETEDPPTPFNTSAGRLALNVKDGTLEFVDLSVDLRGMSRSGTSNLIESADSMAAQGRSDSALHLYALVLLEPTDPQNHLRALRGYARSLWLGLPRNQRDLAGIEKASQSLYRQLKDAASPGEIDYLIGLALTFNPNQRENNLALDRLRKAAAVADSQSENGFSDYGDLARLEIPFVYLRMNMIEESARHFNLLLENGTTSRLYERFGSELAGGGQVTLLLDRVDRMIRAGDNLEVAATLLRAAAAIAPSSRECANHFRRLGRAHSSLGESDKAVEFLHWAERMTPDWFRPYLDEARIHYEAGKTGLAEDALERAMSAIPQSLDLYLGIARLYLSDLPADFSDPVKAEMAARRAIGLTEEANPTAWELLAQALERQGRLDEAMTAVQKAIGIEPSEYRSRLRDDIAAGLASQPAKEGQQ